MRPDAYTLLYGKQAVRSSARLLHGGFRRSSGGVSVLWNEGRCSGLGSDAQREFLLRQVRFSVLICSNVKEKKKRENESNMSECVCDLLSITLDFWTET